MRMKNKFLFWGVLMMLGVLPAISLAQNPVPTIKAELEAKKEALVSAVQEKKQSVIDQIKIRMDQFVQKVVERLGAANNRLEKIAGRIDSRIAKMQAQNIDVAAAKTLLATARTDIETAQTSTAMITADFASSEATSTAALRDEYTVVKTEIEKAKNDIKTAHAALVDVVNSLKPGSNKTGN